MRKYKKVYIEITNVCNLNCNFCPKTERPPEFMSKKRFAHIAQEIKPFTKHVYFHLMGEPFLNSELGEFLKICDSSELKVNITTNGILLKRVEDILLGAPSLRKVSISLHSFEANQAKVTVENYITEVLSFVNKACKKGIICELRLWNISSQEINGRNSLNTSIIKQIENELNLKFEIESALRIQNNIKLKEYLFLHLAQKFEWPDIDSEILDEEVFCYGLRDQFGILVDGTVVPCCLDSEGSISLGNVFEQSLEEILSSDRVNNIYNGFTARMAVEELCKKCGYAKKHKR